MPVERTINVGLTPFNGGTVGSILFIGAGSVVQQDNYSLSFVSNLFSINNPGLGAVALNVFATKAGSVAIFQSNSITNNQTIAAYLFGNAVTGAVVGSSVTGSCTGELLYRIQQSGNGLAAFDALVLGTGDAVIRMYINGGQAWTVGLDNSDSDKFKIAGSGVLGTTDRLSIDANGLVGIGGAVQFVGSANNRVTNNRIIFAATTDAATAVELTTDGATGSGSTNRISVPTGTAMSVVVNICAKQSASANSKQFLRQFLITNTGGVTTIEGAVTVLGTDVGSAALLTASVTITANNTDDCINISVNGIAATNLRWSAYVVSCETLYA